jgi:hypothetical protein
MNNSSNLTTVNAYRAVMTSVFLGFVCTFLSLLYNLFYRLGGIDFSNDLINVAYIIFGEMFLFFLIGFVYLGLRLITAKGDLLFILLFVALTIYFLFAISAGEFAARPAENLRFRGMLHGLTILIGITTLFIPFCYRSAAFQRNVV